MYIRRLLIILSISKEIAKTSFRFFRAVCGNLDTVGLRHLTKMCLSESV